MCVKYQTKSFWTASALEKQKRRLKSRYIDRVREEAEKKGMSGTK